MGWTEGCVLGAADGHDLCKMAATVDDLFYCLTQKERQRQLDREGSELVRAIGPGFLGCPWTALGLPSFWP